MILPVAILVRKDPESFIALGRAKERPIVDFIVVIETHTIRISSEESRGETRVLYCFMIS